MALTSYWLGNILRYCTTRGKAPRFGVAPCGSAWCQTIKSPALPAIGIARSSLVAIARGSAPAGTSFSHAVKLPVKTRDTTERALIGGGIGEVQNRLRAEPQWRRQGHIPMQRGALEAVSRAQRRIHSANIDVDPEIVAVPDLCEGGMDAPRIPVRP